MPETLQELFAALRDQEQLMAWAIDIGAKGLRFFLVLALGALAVRIISSLLSAGVRQLINAGSKKNDPWAAERKKRTATLTNVVTKTVVVAVWAVVVVMALSEVGFDVGPILAGAGVVGLAVGFGAQNVVRDMLGGFFILIEDQIRVGDVAVINGTGGLVEQINLRTTVLRDLQGTVHIFPNGVIDSISNMTRDFSYFVFDVGVAYKEDADRVIDLIRQVGKELRADLLFGLKVLDEVEVFGLDKFDESAIVIKGRIKTLPSQQWSIGREFNRRLKKLFDREGIEIPFPHRTLYLGTGEMEKLAQISNQNGHRERRNEVSV